MSEAIKRMLAEREAVAETHRLRVALDETPAKLLEHEAAMKMVDQAEPFIDEHATDPTKWKPSQMLRIGYFVIGTSSNPRSALGFVQRHLAIARKRYLAGMDPNPFRSVSHEGQ